MNTASIIAALLNLAFDLLRRVDELRAIAKQNGELTPEQEADFDKRRAEAYAKSHWQPSDTPPSSPAG